MKILLVNYEYKPQCGGAGLGTYNMAKTFTDMGHDVSLLIGWDYSFGNPEILDGVDTYIVKTKKKNIHQSTPQGMLNFVIKGLKEIHRITKKNKFDVIQFYFSVPTGILKYGISGRVPYVISLRGMDIPGFRNDKYKVLSIATKSINRAVTEKAAAITSLSDAASKFYLDFSPNAHITTIPNAVDYEIYTPKSSYSSIVKKFVAVSRLTGFKNLELMIEAFAKVHEKYPKIILDIYGEGKEKSNLENKIIELGAEEYVKLQGYANREKLIQLLPQYDCFSLMSIGDSFGIVFIEAMSVGLPIVCAKAGGPMEIVIDGKTGVFAEPNDLEDTVKKIEYCIENPEIMEMMGKNGRKRVIECYSKESVAQKHIELYEKVLAKE